MKEIPELIVSPGLTLGLDHSWNQIGSPQGIPDRRISCPPFLFLRHFSTCSEGPRIGIQSEDQFLGPQRPQLFHGGTEPIYVVRHLVFIPRTLLLPECPWEPVKEVKIDLGTEELPEVMKMFYILTIVMVTWVYINPHWNVYLKWGHFTVCKLHLGKVDFKESKLQTNSM